MCNRFKMHWNPKYAKCIAESNRLDPAGDGHTSIGFSLLNFTSLVWSEGVKVCGIAEYAQFSTIFPDTQRSQAHFILFFYHRTSKGQKTERLSNASSGNPEIPSADLYKSLLLRSLVPDSFHNLPSKAVEKKTQKNFRLRPSLLHDTLAVYNLG